LLFAGTIDPRQRQRFQLEARAAGALHHPNIVPVYAVGCERGLHYYAMQFIDGRTVEALVKGARKSATTAAPPEAADRPRRLDREYFRWVARLGIQAAEALEHAHGLGVVHRDIKPANLLVDGGGRLWVTDFGLARTATDSDLTRTGDVVGTARYMSP